MKNIFQFTQIIIILKVLNLISSNDYQIINRNKYENKTTNSYNASLYEVNITESEKSIEIDLIQIKGKSYLHKYICKKNCLINKENYLYLHYNKEILDSYSINNQQTIFIFPEEFIDDPNEGKLLIAVYCDDDIDCEYYIGTHNNESNILIPENNFCFHIINNNLTYLFNENNEHNKIYIKVMGLFGKFTINFDNEDYDKDVIINGNFLIFENDNIKNNILKMNITRYNLSKNPVLLLVYYSYEKSDLMINNVMFSYHLFENVEKNIVFNYNQRIRVLFESKNCDIEINDGKNKTITNFFEQQYLNNEETNISFKIKISEKNINLNDNNENNFCFIQGYSTSFENNIDNILILNENIQGKILLEEKNKKLSKYLTIIPIPYNDLNNVTGYSFKIELERDSNISLTLSFRNKIIKYSLLYSRVIKLDSLILKYCEKNELCLIKVEIENQINQKRKIKIKIITKNEITYLEENKIITDRLEGPSLIFYKKISSNEKGLITASTVNISPIFNIYFIPIQYYNKSNNYPFIFENPIFENDTTNKENLILEFNSSQKNCSKGCIIFIKTNSYPIEPFINIYYKKNNDLIYIKEFTDIIGNLNYNENNEDDIFILQNYSYLTKRFSIVFDSLNEKIKIEDITDNKPLFNNTNWFISNGKNFTNIKSKEILFGRKLKITVSKINNKTISKRPYIFKIVPQKFDVDLMYITSFTTEICLPELMPPFDYYQCNFFYHPIEGSFLKKLIISAFEEGYGYKKLIKIGMLYNKDFGRNDFDLFQRLTTIINGQISSSSSIEPNIMYDPNDEEKLNENIYLFIKIAGTMQSKIFNNYLYFSTRYENDKIENIYNFEQFYFLEDKLNFTNQINESENNEIYHIQINNHGKRIIFKYREDINKLIDGNFLFTLSNINEIKYEILHCDDTDALVNVKIWKNNINNKYENLPFNKENKILLSNSSLPINFTIKLDYTFEFNVNVKLRNLYEYELENKINLDFKIESYLINEKNQLTKEHLYIRKLQLEKMFIITSSNINKNETFTHLLITLSENNKNQTQIEYLEIDILSFTINTNRYYLQEKSYYYGTMNTSINNSTILFLRPILGKPISIEFSSCSNIIYSIRIFKGYSIYVKKEIKTIKENLVNGKLNFSINIDMNDLPDLKIEIRALNKISELSYYVIKYRFGNTLDFKIDRQLNSKIEELKLTLDWGGISSKDINVMIKPFFFIRINDKQLIDFNTICYQQENSNFEKIVDNNRYLLNDIDKDVYYSSVIAYFIYNDNEEVLLSYENNYINYEMKDKTFWICIIIIYFIVFFIFSGYHFYQKIKEKKITKKEFIEFENFTFQN